MTTKHTCNEGSGPVFGRKAPVGKCARCDELRAGAAPVKWAPSRASIDAQRCKEIAAHFAGHKHRSGQCGPVCTFGEW